MESAQRLTVNVEKPRIFNGRCGAEVRVLGSADQLFTIVPGVQFQR